MGKREIHKAELQELVGEFAATADAGRLTDYMLSGSNLPGRRGNLELALAFGDTVEEVSALDAEPLWRLVLDMIQVSAEEAPVNTPEEFVPFCGAVGVGAIGSVFPQYCDQALPALRALACDRRWRMREAVCVGLQRLLARQHSKTLEALAEWVAGGDFLEMRAAAAAVAEPELLQDQETALKALQLHRRILAQVSGAKETRSEAFRVLRKGLGYTLSVVVCAAPDEGFAYIAQLLEEPTLDVRWIVRENLKKNRLQRPYPDEVKALQAML